MLSKLMHFLLVEFPLKLHIFYSTQPFLNEIQSETSIIGGSFFFKLNVHSDLQEPWIKKLGPLPIDFCGLKDE